MSLSYTIHKKLRLVLSVVEGRVTLDDLNDLNQRLQADPEFDETFDRLNDLTGATSIDVSADNVQLLAKSDLSAPNSRRAIVTDKPSHFGIARQFELHRSELSTVHVFRNREEALRWLRIPKDSGLY